MTFLADACAIIVFHGYGGQTMSHAGKMAMSTGDVFVASITVWEIARKVALGKLERPAPPGFNGTLSEWLRQVGYRALPLTWDVAERANGLPMHHKDPMDRMLIAAALERSLTVITDDTVFREYKVATIW
ncbi:type II toxin-antitoxin system VapC family toxin [Rhodopila sp.]|uniref:type II toxin-antitoxin system VapC family toxin n=1 Tax=Rhodopila sp. TaxID=2480087 RepID=UPI003D0C966C